MEAFKVHNIDELMRRHIDNLKPIVCFNTVTAHKLALELLDKQRMNLL